MHCTGCSGGAAGTCRLDDKQDAGHGVKGLGFGAAGGEWIARNSDCGLHTSLEALLNSKSPKHHL